MAVVRNVARGVAVRFTVFDQPQRVLSSLWIVLLLSMVFVQPYNGMYPQLVPCAGLGDGSCSRGQSVFVGCFLYKHTFISPYTLVVVEFRKPAVFFNILSKLYVWVDRVQMIMKLFHVDFL